MKSIGKTSQLYSSQLYTGKYKIRFQIFLWQNMALWANDPDTFMINTDPQPFIITCWNLYFVIPSIQDLNCLYSTETETADCYAWWRRVNTAFVCSLVLWIRIRIRIRRARMLLGLPDPIRQDLDPDPSINKQKKLQKSWFPLFCDFFWTFYLWRLS